jgi:hypothetical protein
MQPRRERRTNAALSPACRPLAQRVCAMAASVAMDGRAIRCSWSCMTFASAGWACRQRTCANGRQVFATSSGPDANGGPHSRRVACRGTIRRRYSTSAELLRPCRRERRELQRVSHRLSQAAARRDDLARNPGSVIGGEKGDDLGDVVSDSKASEGGAANHHRFQLACEHGARHLRRGCSRRNGV